MGRASALIRSSQARQEQQGFSLYERLPIIAYVFGGLATALLTRWLL
ncbi:hypothetical protein [Gorillibacterium timonense]|nr:hypothetical protein [Gorillibacterium timonense]